MPGCSARPGKLAERLILLRLELCALRGDAGRLQRVETRLGGCHQGGSAGHLRLQAHVCGWRATSLQEVQLCLGRLYRCVGGLNGRVGGGASLSTGGAVWLRDGLPVSGIDYYCTDPRHFLFERGLIGFGRGLLRLALGHRRLRLGNGRLGRIVGLAQRCLGGCKRGLCLDDRRLRRLDVGLAAGWLVDQRGVGRAHCRLRCVDLRLERIDLTLETLEVRRLATTHRRVLGFGSNHRRVVGVDRTDRRLTNVIGGALLHERELLLGRVQLRLSRRRGFGSATALQVVELGQLSGQCGLGSRDVLRPALRCMAASLACCCASCSCAWATSAGRAPACTVWSLAWATSRLARAWTTASC